MEQPGSSTYVPNAGKFETPKEFLRIRQFRRSVLSINRILPQHWSTQEVFPTLHEEEVSTFEVPARSERRGVQEFALYTSRSRSETKRRGLSGKLFDLCNSTWIKLGASFISLWGIDGPRTTNSAESYHGRQQYHFRKKARLGEWIIRNRELHYREKMEANTFWKGKSIRINRSRSMPNTEEEYNNTIILKFERVSLKDVVSEESTDKQELEVIELPAKKMQSAYDVEPTQFLEIEADGIVSIGQFRTS
uniref:Uncharacterized protein n=1 Tax=Ditylenchus dipsaci TaxID=166011 RepID=A0A915D1W3_9BILA